MVIEGTPGAEPVPGLRTEGAQHGDQDPRQRVLPHRARGPAHLARHHDRSPWPGCRPSPASRRRPPTRTPATSGSCSSTRRSRRSTLSSTGVRRSSWSSSTGSRPSRSSDVAFEAPDERSSAPERRRQQLAYSRVRERGARGVHAARAVHAAAGMGRRRREVEPADGVSARPSPGTGRKISSWCSWAVPPLIAPPIRLASRCSISRGPSTRRAMTRDPKPGRDLLDPRLHPVGEPLAVVPVPDPADAVVAGVADRVLRHVRVGPQRLGAGRRAGRVGRRHLAGQHERRRRDGPRRHLAERLGHLLDRVGDVERAGVVRRRLAPTARRRRAPSRP